MLDRLERHDREVVGDVLAPEDQERYDRAVRETEGAISSPEGMNLVEPPMGVAP